MSGTGKLMYGNTKVVSFKLEEMQSDQSMLIHYFMECYTQLRQSCPRGDLHINLYVLADSAEEVGVVYEPETEEQREARWRR